MTFKTALIGLALLGASIAALGFFWPFGRQAGELRLPGVVEIQEVRLGSKVGGRVAEVLTAEGQTVEAGQVLVRFEEPELEAQRQQLESRVRMMEADLEKARNGPRPQEVEQARSDLRTAQADLVLARRELERVQSLIGGGASTQAESDTARANFDRSRGRVASAQARLDLLLAGTRPEEIRMSEAQLNETRGKLREVEANLREAVVVAPERAIVEVLAVRKGDLVPANTPILRVLRADDLWVRVYVPETELGKVRLNQEAEVTVDSYPGRRLQGKVIQINAASEFTPRNVQSVEERRYQVFGLKVHVPDPNGIFKSGMAAEVFLPLH